ncbi:MAG: carboxypeptidase-like regulatory domain-containing protein [Gemmatimonadaceae bacterium]
MYRGAANQPLNGVEVTIDATNRKPLTNDAGEFRFPDLWVARHVIELHHLGFAPLVDTVVVIAGQPVNREYVMATQAVPLGAVLTTEANDRHITEYDEFLARGEHHNGGHYIGWTVLHLMCAFPPLNGVLAGTLPELEQRQHRS